MYQHKCVDSVLTWRQARVNCCNHTNLAPFSNETVTQNLKRKFYQQFRVLLCYLSQCTFAKGDTLGTLTHCLNTFFEAQQWLIDRSLFLSCLSIYLHSVTGALASQIDQWKLKRSFNGRFWGYLGLTTSSCFEYKYGTVQIGSVSTFLISWEDTCAFLRYVLEIKSKLVFR